MSTELRAPDDRRNRSTSAGLRSSRHRLATLIALLGVLLPAAAAAGQPPLQTPAPDPEAGEEPAAAVRLGGETVIWITAGAGPYTKQFRADRIGQRLRETVHDRTLQDVTVTVTDVQGSSELRAGQRLLMVVTPKDAESLGLSRASLARQYARAFEEAIRVERQRYAPATLIRSGLYGLAATLMFGAALWLIHRLGRATRRFSQARLAVRSASLRAMHEELLTHSRFPRILAGAARVIRVVLILVAVELYLTFVLSLFPWTREVSRTLLDYAVTPVRTVAAAFVAYLPKGLFLAVIGAVIYAAIRIVAHFFRQIQEGRIVFANFPAEWADPTNKIARVLLIAFGVVVAFPYLPASDSPAFAGVSVFMGVREILDMPPGPRDVTRRADQWEPRTSKAW